jgi:hypothetical protein
MTSNSSRRDRGSTTPSSSNEANFVIKVKQLRTQLDEMMRFAEQLPEPVSSNSDSSNSMFTADLTMLASESGPIHLERLGRLGELDLEEDVLTSTVVRKVEKQTRRALDFLVEKPEKVGKIAGFVLKYLEACRVRAAG